MDIEFVKERLERSAEISSEIWAEIKERLSSELSDGDSTFEIIDIQTIEDDCVDLILIRKNKDAEMRHLDQLERCRISAQPGLLRKARINMSFETGPFVKDFFNSEENS